MCFSGVPSENRILSFKWMFELPRPLKSLFLAISGKQLVLKSSWLSFSKNREAKKQFFSLLDIKAILSFLCEIIVLIPPFLWSVKLLGKIIFFFFIFFFYLFFFFFNFFFKISNLRLILIDYLKPFSSIFTYPINKVSDVLEKIDYLVELDANSLELKKKVHKYEDELNKLYHLKVENIELKSLLNLKSPPSDYTITGRIIIDPKNFKSQNIYIDVGSDDNVKVNNPVLNKNGLIGRIVKVNKDASEVLLITDSKSNLPVISMDTNMKFFLNGSLNGFVIKHLEDH